MVDAVQQEKSLALPKQFLILARALGGPKVGDIASHVGVALGVIKATWREERLHPTLRGAIVGVLLENLIRGRSLDQIVAIIGAFREFGRQQLGDLYGLGGSLNEYLEGWMRGHFLV